MRATAHSTGRRCHGMIGDPSMKSQERKLLDEETLRHNQEAIKKQLSHFLDFDSDAPMPPSW